MGGSQLPYSVSNSTSERPQMGSSQLPYSYSAGPGQVLRNPYAKSRNPYEERSAPPEPYYQPQSSPRPYEDQRAAPSSRPTYSAFPRAQISRGY
ncbi:uncharacterized protein zgc:158432 [Trichomycterus rosablanca]|uniref:uncharacterized protein zgc:158432 n=1 Tax=Trichomycterus rosablanca TaxID=2290929 RepID=UPI002F35C06D